VSTIDRIRYYDGEFLRAFDFDDEQTYHVEMRRRLNRYLHLAGIVYGLQLQQEQDAVGVSILPGLAIDALGREIYVFSPYTLGDSDIVGNRISQAGQYEVWLRYNKTAGTPPSSGYSSCNQTDQYTRWAETFSVVLLPSSSSGFTPPSFTDEDTDDPSEDQVGVRLGTVSIDPNASTEFYGATQDHRHFAGIIAQRIQTPLPYDATQSFQFQTKQSPHKPPVSLAIEPNIFAQQNFILGPDFDLTTTPAGKPITANPSFGANAAGNAKLAGDLVVQGNIYSSVPDQSGNPQWLGLAAYVKQLVQQGQPDIASGTQWISIPVQPPNTFAAGVWKGTTQVPVTMNRLTSGTSQQVIVSISQIQSASQTALNTLFTGGAQIGLQIVNVGNFQPSGSGMAGYVNVTWQAQPGSAAPATCAIDNFTVTCWVIILP